MHNIKKQFEELILTILQGDYFEDKPVKKKDDDAEYGLINNKANRPKSVSGAGGFWSIFTCSFWFGGAEHSDPNMSEENEDEEEEINA